MSVGKWIEDDDVPLTEVKDAIAHTKQCPPIAEWEPNSQFQITNACLVFYVELQEYNAIALHCKKLKKKTMLFSWQRARFFLIFFITIPTKIANNGQRSSSWWNVLGGRYGHIHYSCIAQLLQLYVRDEALCAKWMGTMIMPPCSRAIRVSNMSMIVVSQTSWEKKHVF